MHRQTGKFCAGFAKNRVVDEVLCIETLKRFSAFLLTSLFVFLLCDLLAWQTVQSALNWIFPSMLFLGCLWTAVKLLRYNATLVWTPFPWFLAATAVYFGMGPLSYTFGNAETVAYMNLIFPVDQAWLWRTTLLNIVGTLTITLTFLIMLKVLRVKLPASRQSSSNIRKVKLAVLLFLAIGVPVKYLLALPYELRLSGFELPGSVFMLEHFVLFALLLLAYLSSKKGGTWSIVLVVLFSLEVLVEFLRFNKSQFLLLFVFLAMGQYWAKRNMRVLILGAVVTVGAYICVSPIVSWGRNEITRESGVHYRATLGDRFRIVWNGISSGQIGGEQIHSERLWWLRLCYANAQAFAMDAYDNGRPGNTFLLAFWTFVPRFLYPEKPIISSVGIEFTELALGQSGSYTGIGIFGESYWNGGWFTVIAACSYIGALFACLSKVGLTVMSKSEFLFLPCVFMGIQMGFRIDGWFVGDYVGPVVIYTAYLTIIYFLFIKGSPDERPAK